MTETAGEQTGATHGGEAAVPASPPTPGAVQIPASRSVTGRDETVWLHPEVTIPIGVAALAAINLSAGRGQAVTEAAVGDVFLRLGIARWTFTDAKGEPEPVDDRSIARLLPFNGGGLDVVEAADILYGEAVLRPLLAKFSARSPTSPTGATTPPSSPGGPTSPTPTSPSSPADSAGGKPSGDPAP